jgi:hypothetical protein
VQSRKLKVRAKALFNGSTGEMPQFDCDMLMPDLCPKVGIFCGFGEFGGGGGI